MFIAPGTRVNILHNVPLDNTYEHTIWFDDAQAQADYFSGLAKYRYTDFTYQRVNNGTMRVGRKADDLYDCNYLMFKNTNFGNKWFYAFITEVDYINNECSNVSFQIDVLQTWHFNYEFAETFVEREHSASDGIGANITPEPVSPGEYVFNDYEIIDRDMQNMAVILAIVDTDGETRGELYDGVYGAAELYVYDSTDVQGINEKVNEYVQKPDAIIAMYMVPMALIQVIPSTHKISYGMTGTTIVKTYAEITKNDTINGYKPRNAKLFTYPFNFFHVDNASGSGLTLRYEFFTNLRPVLQYGGTITQPVQVICRPCNYKYAGDGGEMVQYVTVNTESLTLQGYPMCSWNVDAYEAWIAQNSLPIAMQTLGSAINMGMAYQSGEALPATSAINTVTNVLGQMYSASIAADIEKGNFNNGGANVAMHKQAFFVGRMSVTAQMAAVIDDFFDMFGYATKRVKKPNRNVRPHWNYVKTVSCNIHGSIPADDMRRICEIYDNGVTFWMHGDEVGNYALDNRL